MRFVPCYSLGGPSGGGWNAVNGTTNTSTGNPIDVGGADPTPANWPVMEIICTGGTATVVLEVNGGVLDTTFNPPSGEWVDISNGGFSMTSGQTIAKRFPPNIPIVRTRITALSGATVVSYVPCICYPGGRWASAQHPQRNSSGVA